MTDVDREDTARAADDANDEQNVTRHRVRLPNFILDEPTGAGQVVSRLTSAVGIRPCEPCRQRAARLDQWLRFEPRR
jgi:hypothetical protein